MPAKKSNPPSRRKILAAKLVVQVVRDQPDFSGDRPYEVSLKRAVGRYRHLRAYARRHHALAR